MLWPKIMAKVMAKLWRKLWPKIMAENYGKTGGGRDGKCIVVNVVKSLSKLKAYENE